MSQVLFLPSFLENRHTGLQWHSDFLMDMSGKWQTWNLNANLLTKLKPQ